MEKTNFTDIDDYISQASPANRERLQAMRQAIRAAAPLAEERISYQMPAFWQQGMLVYFAGFKNHIGFYPTSSPVAAFAGELASYKHAKGSIQFPHDRELPLDLVGKITAFRVAELSAAPAKNTKNSKK